jgi:hypothetical protein
MRRATGATHAFPTPDRISLAAYAAREAETCARAAIHLLQDPEDSSAVCALLMRLRQLARASMSALEDEFDDIDRIRCMVVHGE